MQKQNSVNRLSSEEHNADELIIMHTIANKLMSIEAQIEEHASITKAQGQELIEIRKDQEHLYQNIQAMRSEIAQLFFKIEDHLGFPENKN